MAGWAEHKELVRLELEQSLEEGKAPSEILKLKELWNQTDDRASLESLHKNLLELPIREDLPFTEPNGLEEIRALRPSRHTPDGTRENEEPLSDKLHGAWLGRCVGCALGKPVERFMNSYRNLLSWQRQKKLLTAISEQEWPIRDYFPQYSPAEEETDKTGSPLSTREGISFMESDDDIRYTIIGQIVLSNWGRNFLSVHVARTWMEWLGYSHVCTAETAAYRNLVIGYDIQFHRYFSPERSQKADREVDWGWVSSHLNPYREWIGAQIRVDSYGYAAPGNPELAADFAWRDARISHQKNGLYGAMFIAAMIATAFVTDDIDQIIQSGLEQIPENCRLSHAIHQTIELCEQYGRDFGKFEHVIAGLYERFNAYNAVHTINNAALCVAALLLSRGNFHKGVTLAVMGGWDTDCNGATVGSILGAICGAEQIPDHWGRRLNDRVESLIAGYHPIAISECARRSLEIVGKMNLRGVQ